MYKKPNEKTWFYLDLITLRSKNTIKMNFYFNENTYYDVMIYGPLLVNLTKLNIEIPDNYQIFRITPHFEKSILIAGGLNSFGIGCTSAGNKFSNILSRKLNVKIYNLTYNSKNYLKQVFTDLSTYNLNNKFDIGIIELDYINQNDYYVNTFLEEIYELMNKRCANIIGWFSISDKNYKKENIFNILKEKEINIIDINSQHENFKDMCTFSNNFINDTGNVFIYKSIKEIVTELI